MKGKQPAAVFSGEGLRILLDFVYKVVKEGATPEELDSNIGSLVRGYEAYHGQPEEMEFKGQNERIAERTSAIEQIVYNAGPEGIRVKDLIECLQTVGYSPGKNPKGYSSALTHMISYSNRVVKKEKGVYIHVDFMGVSHSELGEITRAKKKSCGICKNNSALMEHCINCKDNMKDCPICDNDPEYVDGCTHCGGAGKVEIK